jgi:hypothetical protein
VRAVIRIRSAVLAVALLGSAVAVAAPGLAANAALPGLMRPRSVAAGVPTQARDLLPVEAVAPAITGDDATLNGVACTSAIRCLAAGFFFARAEGSTFGLSETWNGHRWGTLTVSGLTTKSAVTAALEVSCGAPTNCMIVGYHYKNPSLPVQFADILSATWTPVKWNNPAGARWSVLDDVKCVDTAFCMAIGIFSKTSGGGRALAELWNGHSWRQLRVPNPANLHGTDLSALWCESTTDCQAVGAGQNSAHHLANFAEHWNGSRWTLGRIPNVRGRANALNDVACFASGDCVAVGFTRASGTLRPLVVRLHGGRWHIVTTPGRRDAALLGISCPTVTLCVAVGFQGKSPLTEKWNGSRWTVLRTRRTGGSKPDDSLQHVSCTSAVHCVAVGFRYNARRRFSNHTLIEVWNGAIWRIQTSVNP